MRRIPVLIGALVIAGCRAHTSASPAPVMDPRAALDSATAHYARVLKGMPVDSILTAWSDSGELDLPGMSPIPGRAAIHDFLAPMAGQAHVESVEMHVDSATFSGNTAVSSGTWRQVAILQDNQPHEFHGTYDARWVRAADGRWLFRQLVMKPES